MSGFRLTLDGVGGVAREANARLLGKTLEPLRAIVGRFKINQLFFADDTALVDPAVLRGGVVQTACFWYSMRKKKVVSESG